mmetsp:Transcript_43754/g.145782  ORF Transcript_43754/g.145782 Transcript_43754/m.145782 type:complete len:211 (-) Transcript_43754:536-1168(-)
MLGQHTQHRVHRRQQRRGRDLPELPLLRRRHVNLWAGGAWLDEQRVDVAARPPVLLVHLSADAEEVRLAVAAHGPLLPNQHPLPLEQAQDVGEQLQLLGGGLGLLVGTGHCRLAGRAGHLLLVGRNAGGEGAGRGEVDATSPVEQRRDQLVLDEVDAQLVRVELDLVVVAVRGEDCARVELAQPRVESGDALPDRHLRRHARVVGGRLVE